MINNKLIIKRFNAANVTAIFELTNFFTLNFHFFVLLLSIWAVLRAKNFTFAVRIMPSTFCSNFCAKWSLTYR